MFRCESPYTDLIRRVPCFPLIPTQAINTRTKEAEVHRKSPYHIHCLRPYAVVQHRNIHASCIQESFSMSTWAPKTTMKDQPRPT
ncbi:hypothetical protein BDV23DRAFT_163349 [Aspergillus alliaceus]|uniref:Uncharacterized protein n=1 Tax=Petromyces alliaceus TaxID=209559 RepID=A0A5N7BX61_PETAA|nr:hypothetical protein BDV23DRAFT_163349 [Aspergillus alliaceus]